MFIEYRGKVPRVAASAFVAPTAVLIGDVVIGEESSIWFGAVLRADDAPIVVGARTSIEDNAVVHASAHPTTIGDDVTVGHCAVLDDCSIGNGALVGSNAVVLHGARVGDHSLVAAGSVVTDEEPVPARVVAAGAPATVRKALEGHAAELIAQATDSSLAQARSYRRDNIGDPAHHEIKSAKRGRKPSAVVV
jgi:carbonic anhydrase/acetyltransferase-like protein (isoleucine patch superfamily)